MFDLRTQLIQSVIKADTSLYTELNPGIAITRVVTHPQTVMALLGGAATTLLRDGTTAVAMLCYLLYLAWRLTLIAFVVLPFMAWVIRVIHKRSKATGGVAFNAEMQLVSRVDDIARAWCVVCTFDAGDWERHRFEQAGRNLQRAALKSSVTSSLMSPVSQLITGDLQRCVPWQPRSFALWHSLQQFNPFKAPIGTQVRLQTVHDANFLYLKKGAKQSRYTRRLQRLMAHTTEVITISQYVRADLQEKVG